MESISESLKLLCEAEPEARFRVVITVDPAWQATADPVLRHTNIQAIPNVPGIFSGELTGAEVLTLATYPEVENIVEDFDVQAQCDHE